MNLEQILKLRTPDFNKDVGVEFIKVENYCAESRIKVEGRHMNSMGAVHGGCIFTLMDATSGVAAVSGGNYVTTSSGNVLYLNAAVNTRYIRAFAKPIKRGKNLQIFDVEVLDDNDKLLAKATFTFFTLGPISIPEGERNNKTREN